MTHHVQGEDPATDVRGAGVFGLDNLLYLSTRHPVAFKRLMGKTEGQRSDWEYPFAVAGLNLTFDLGSMVGLSGKLPSSKTAEGGWVGRRSRKSEREFSRSDLGHALPVCFLYEENICGCGLCTPNMHDA